MLEYLFVLGRTSDLCRAELEAVLKRNKINYQVKYASVDFLRIATKTEIDFKRLMGQLGGCIKIALVINNKQIGDEKEIIDLISSKLLEKGNSKKIIFGLSSYGKFNQISIPNISGKIKDELLKHNLNSRFILPRNEPSLSSVVIAKQKVSEFILFKENDASYIAQTLIVQDFEQWGKRDFERPRVDPHRGMLPPKVSRMMVNLGSSEQTADSSLTILDPFCGVGTILMEAMMMGNNITGNDFDKESINKTRDNLIWLIANYQLPATDYQLHSLDATHISEIIPSETIDAIITEPYLGPVIDTDKQKYIKIEKLKNIILGLDKLYIGCLREWKKILKPDGKIVMALPSFKVGDDEFFVKRAIDTCENLGYNLEAGPFVYSRPQAVVRRNIYILSKQ
ncbi:MAG: methyltransferase domain-containing protein [Candidatus Gottesmanbacteria bacterium]